MTPPVDHERKPAQAGNSPRRQLGAWRARTKRRLVLGGWLLYLVSLLWPARTADGDWMVGTGAMAAVVGSVFAFSAAHWLRVSQLAAALTLVLPNILILSTPFAYRRRISERLLYQLLLVAAAIAAGSLAVQARQLDFFVGIAQSSVVWAASVALVALGFLIEPVAASSWPWSRGAGASSAVPPSPRIAQRASGQWVYDIFLSYASAYDYQTVRRLEAFLESFHETKVGGVQLRPLNVCTDLSDFRLPPRDSRRERIEPSAEVAHTLKRYLDQSEFLLVLCCPESAQSPWVAHEIQSFLRNRDEQFVFLAVTGGDPVKDPENVFPELVRERRLHERLYFDLRGTHRLRTFASAKVKNANDESFRIASELLTDVPAHQIRPIWSRERQKQRFLFSLSMLIAAAGLIPVAMVIGDLLLFKQAFNYSSSTQRLTALSRLVRWYGYQGDDLAKLLTRENDSEIFGLLTLGCGREIQVNSDAFIPVAEKLSFQAPGPVFAALHELQRVFPGEPAFRTPSTGALFVHLADIDSILGYSDMLKFSIGGNNAWIVKAPVDRSVTVFDAYRTVMGSGHLPTPDELRSAYAAGLPRLEREWCSFEQASDAAKCDACLMVGDKVTEVPFAEVPAAATRAAVRFVATRKP